MLPSAARLRRAGDFTTVVKTGRRTGTSTVVVHLLPAEAADSPDPDSVPVASSPRAGFVVSKAVGNAVVRHRVARRLRAQVAARLPELPGGSRLVIRALPAAAAATSAVVGADLDKALRRLLADRPADRQPGPMVERTTKTVDDLSAAPVSAGAERTGR